MWTYFQGPAVFELRLSFRFSISFELGVSFAFLTSTVAPCSWKGRKFVFCSWWKYAVLKNWFGTFFLLLKPSGSGSLGLGLGPLFLLIFWPPSDFPELNCCDLFFSATSSGSYPFRLRSSLTLRIEQFKRLIGEVLQSRRRPLLGPSPGWKCLLLALSHLRHY